MAHAHFASQLDVLQAPILDHLGISHENGGLSDEGMAAAQARTRDELAQAALLAFRTHPTFEMGRFLLALALVIPDPWSALNSVLPTVADELELVTTSTHRSPDPRVPSSQVVVQGAATAWSPGVATPVQDHGESARAAQAPARSAGADTSRLSPLDEQLILRIADSLQGTLAAPDEATIDSIIDELISLNAQRHQSFYHLGFHDAVRSRPARPMLPAQNTSRWRWYYAGLAAGLERLEKYDAILELFDTREEVKTLGDSGRGPSRYGAMHVLRALIRRGRSSDIVAFAQPAAVARFGELRKEVLKYGTSLQREFRFSDAMPVFEVLMRALSATDGELDLDEWATVRRRFAHCLREGGQLEAARRLLEAILRDSDDVHRAMVLVDIGLTEAGFKRLADLRLGSTKDECARLARALDASMVRFSEAKQLDVTTSSHAYYVLGFRALLSRNYEAAERDLDHAVASFELEPGRYDRLLAQARVHVAIARCASTEAGAQRLEAAIDDLVHGVGAGAWIPELFMVEVIAGLTLNHQFGVQGIESLLGIGGESLLDILREEESVFPSRAIAGALRERSARPHRTSIQRMTDGRSALQMLLLQAERCADPKEREKTVDLASQQLDALEELTFEAKLFEEFEYLLANEPRLEMLWATADVDAARIRALEGQGRYRDAAQLLIRQFHAVVARSSGATTASPEDILETLATYPHAETLGLDELRRRLTAAPRLSSSPPKSLRPISILVVGGNETQAQYDESIRAGYSDRAWLTVDFMHTGWSSNWGSFVDEFARRLPGIDAVVVLSMMRTGLGRSIRSMCDTKPWRGCHGTGKASIVRAIDAAVTAALGSPAARKRV
ncbi:MAG: hypothetical protein IT361_03480 [Gemmatimonadaceae bacterium]|nr:hypothetical protein [Gemmatimonadaceae bacterium]